MTFEQLKFFTVLAKTMNYTKASEALFISQPTLSRQIILLEEELQTKLFIRTYKSMRLSPAGEIFLEECKKLMLNYNQLFERMNIFKTGLQGTLVGASIEIYYSEFNKTVRDFCSENPDIHFVFQHHPTGKIQESVRSGESDIGLCFSFEVSPEENFVIEPIHQECFKLLVPDNHPLADRTRVSINDMDGERLILPGNDRNVFIHTLFERLQIAGAPKTTELNDPDNIHTIILNVQANNFAAILPAPLTKGIEGCVALDIDDVDTSFQTIMISHADNNNPPLLLFKNYFKEHFKKG